MKKHYTPLVLFALFSSFVSTAQYFIPFTGSNTVPSGTVTLCTHAGCGVTYGPNAEGYTVVYPGACGPSTVIGTYATESCCDYVRIHNGIGTGGTQLANYAGTGSFTFVAQPNQTISIRFHSDGSIQNSGLQATVVSAPDLVVNNSVYDYTICTGTSLTLTADGMDTYTWTPFVLSNSIVVNPMTSTSYTVSGTSTVASGCTIDRTVNITVNITPTISITGNTVVCGPGSTEQLSVIGAADNYLWNNGQTTPVIIIAPLQLTTYSVLATNNVGGCQDSDAFTVAYSDNPVVSVMSNDLEICNGSSVTIFASGASSYTWTTGSNSSFIQDAPATSTIYQVTGSNQYGCTASATVPVIVNPVPVLNVTAGRDMMCPGETIELTASGADSYQWSSPSFFMPVQTINPKLDVTTTFVITGTTNKGCTSTTTYQQIVSDCTSLNETAGISGLSLFPNPGKESFELRSSATINEIVIHDMAGRQVFTSHPATSSTRFTLDEVSSGVYFVTVSAGESIQVLKLIKQ